MDTKDLFDKLYRDELDALEDDQEEKAVPKTGTKRSRVPKKKVVYHPKVETYKKVAHKTELAKQKVVKKKPSSAVSRDSAEEASPNKRAKMKRIELDETGSKPKISGGSDKLKIVLLCVVLVIAVGFIISSLGIVDFGSLLGFSEQPKKERIKPRVAKKLPAKNDKKPIRVARKSPQQISIPKAPNKSTSQKRTLIVKKPSQVFSSEPQPQTVKISSKAATTGEKPAITQQRYRPATPVKKSTIVQPPPKPAAPQQRHVVAMQPSQPSTSKQKPALAPIPSKSMTLSPGTVVAKKPPERSIYEPKSGVVRETLKPAAHTRKEEASAEAEPPQQERINTYPYSVYLGSYPSRERADKAVSGYVKEGLSPYYVKVDLGDKGVWYRVFAGRYKNKDEAEALIKEKGLVDAEVRKKGHAIPTRAFLSKDKSNTKKGLKEEERPPRTTTLSYPYSIYLGSYRTIESVEEAISPYRQKGLSPYWVKVDLGNKGVWYRLFAGYFQKRKKAEEFIEEEGIEEAESRHTRYANLLGSYDSEEELNAQKIALSGLGYCPYVVKGVHGESLLYAGAFYHKGRAEKQRAELASKGIQSQVVER
ncbi:MAG: SPOR domain-containing protein [Desulfobacteraceae bacterium]|nr:MAG: SPOR domain-containing protein [Desulfobacteraceae bacterium]